MGGWMGGWEGARPLHKYTLGVSLSLSLMCLRGCGMVWGLALLMGFMSAVYELHATCVLNLY